MNSIVSSVISKLKALFASPFYSALVLSLLIGAVYWPLATFDFVRWDDQINVYENPHLNPPSWDDVKHFWTSSKQETTQPNLPVMYVYRPAVYTVWAGVAYVARLSTPMRSTENEIYHLNPHVFHTVNLVFHLANSLLVLALLGFLCRSSGAALWGAALFALHPIQVEAVAWVTGLNDLLCAFFALTAALLYLRSAQRLDVIHNTSSLILRILAIFAFLLALLAKPSAVVLPFILFLIDTLFLRRDWRQSTRALCPWLIPAIAIIVITKFAEPEAARIYSPLWARPLIALDALAFYLSKIAYPIWLGPDYGRTPKAVLQNGWAYLTWIAPFALAFVAWSLRKRYAWFYASILIWVVGLLPVLGLAPFRYQNHSTVADRYMYLPFLGVALFAACSAGVARQSRIPKSGMMALALGVVLVCAMLSARQARFWQSNATLFKHTRDVHPTSWVAHANYGAYLLHIGRFQEAAQSFELALREDPDYFPLHTDLAFALAQQGKYQEAKGVYSKALEKRPESAAALAGLGNVYDREGNLSEAITLYRRALSLYAEWPEVHYNLGHALYRLGRNDDAIAAFQSALKIVPDDAAAHNGLALAFAKSGEMGSAESHWQQALRHEPQYVEAHVNLGVLRAQQGKLQEAVVHWQSALKSEPKNVDAHYYLGVVLAGQEKTQEATTRFQEVIRLQPNHAGAQQALDALLSKKHRGPVDKE